MRRCQELPGEELFQYLDDKGEVRSVDFSDVNDYLRAVMGEDFTAKDFRTWGASVLALDALTRHRAGGNGKSDQAQSGRRRKAGIRVFAQYARHLSKQPHSPRDHRRVPISEARRTVGRRHCGRS